MASEQNPDDSAPSCAPFHMVLAECSGKGTAFFHREGKSASQLIGRHRTQRALTPKVWGS